MSAVRLDVTPYSELHLGHVWVGWQAAQWALARGCEFLLRFDDAAYWRGDVGLQSWSLPHAAERFLDDFAWLEIVPDRLRYTSEVNEEVRHAAHLLGIREPQPGDGRGGSGLVLLKGNGAIANWHSWGALVQVVSDHANRVVQIVRGQELVAQEQLYWYFWARLYGGLPPVLTYVKLVWRYGAGEKESKSSGVGISVRDLRAAGYTPEEIIGTLRECDRRSMEPDVTLRPEHLGIPAGILEPGTHGVLEFQDPTLPGHLLEVRGKLWEEDVRALLLERYGYLPDLPQVPEAPELTLGKK